MKVGKEDIAALVVALERFVAIDEDQEKPEYARRSDYLVAALADIPGVSAETRLAEPGARPVVPRAFIELEADYPMSGERVAEILEAGRPALSVAGSGRSIRVDVMQMEAWELKTAAAKLRELLTNPVLSSSSD